MQPISSRKPSDPHAHPSGRARSLKISVSGVRGIVGESFTPHLVAQLAQAFGSYVGRGDILVGRDTRASGPMVEEALVAGLLAVGCRPVLLGICPIPSILVKARYSQAAGAIAITASHNPIEWNALKFVTSRGLFLNAQQAQELLDVYHQAQFSLVENAQYRHVKTEPDAMSDHLRRLTGYLDVERIRAARIAVAFDCCNGAGSVLTPRFLDMLGCRTHPMYATPDGRFPRGPEPTPDNLGDLSALVKKTGAAVGFAQDIDADRLAVVDERGRPIGEDYTVALAMRYVLSKTPGTVVANLSASRAIDDVAAEFGCPVVRTKIGEINVTEALLARGAVVGGEGTGGIIIPAVHPCRDSFAGMGVVLEYLATSGKTVSQLVAEIPHYDIVRGRLECSTQAAHRIVRELRRRYTGDGAAAGSAAAGESISTLDGIKIDRPDGWIHVRPSNTEPILRLTAEATTRDHAEELLARFRAEAEEIALASSHTRGPEREGGG
jgi:phosphomannomutase